MSCLVKTLAGCGLPQSQDCRLDSWGSKGVGLLWGQQEGSAQDCRSDAEFPCPDVSLSLFRQPCGRTRNVSKATLFMETVICMKSKPFPCILCQKKHDYARGSDQAAVRKPGLGVSLAMHWTLKQVTSPPQTCFLTWKRKRLDLAFVMMFVCFCQLWNYCRLLFLAIRWTEYSTLLLTEHSRTWRAEY